MRERRPRRAALAFIFVTVVLQTFAWFVARPDLGLPGAALPLAGLIVAAALGLSWRLTR